MSIVNALPEKYVNEWHPILNGALKSDQVSAGSNKKVWWQCKEGHEWESAPKNRAATCPVCSGNKIISGINDFATLQPAIYTEWHPDKNADINPYNLAPKANKKVWWQCSYGHEWQAVINNRVSENHGCPVCAGRKVSIGFNDLATTRPDIAAEWHPNKNSGFKPTEITKGCNKKVWWICASGHEWEAKINNRVALGRGCPVCVGQKVIGGINDFATTSPNLLPEWNNSKNIGMSPTEFSPKSNKKVWWICSLGHEWEAKISNRANGKSCPICSGNVVFAGFNDLKSQNSIISNQWHPSKNLTNDTSTINYQSGATAWWICSLGHEWKTRINHRTTGIGCPTCAAGLSVSKPEKELAKFVESLGYQITTSARRIVKNFELDILIPSLNVAIEYNGLYWHSEAKKPNVNYHYDKWLACQQQGIELIQIWEDQWINNPELVKSLLVQRLNNSFVQTVSAQSSSTEVIKAQEARKFLNFQHLQGFASASHHIGLHDKESHKLIAVMSLKRSADALNIVRFAASENRESAFDLFLTFAGVQYSPQSFMFIDDLSFSHSTLLEKHGFIACETLKPDYMYTKGKKKLVKSALSLQKFKKDNSLVWQEGASLNELLKLNNFYRIWSAGSVVWSKPWSHRIN